MDAIVGGVDFSGAANASANAAKDAPHASNDAWLALASVGSQGVEIVDVEKVGAHALSRVLNENKSVTLVGVDAPFSLPNGFLKHLAQQVPRGDFESWQQIAEHLVFTSQDDFIGLVSAYKKDEKRFCDSAVQPSAQSPLHRGNPAMAQMTFQTIRMLATLDPKRFWVLPFGDPIAFGCGMLEVYPRATLNFFGLTESGYKSKDKKDYDKVSELRRKIATDLQEIREKKGVTFKDIPRLSIPKKFMHFVAESDHALDAIIACYTTGMFKLVPQFFADPLAADNLDVLLEGWIYSAARAK